MSDLDNGFLMIRRMANKKVAVGRESSVLVISAAQESRKITHDQPTCFSLRRNVRMVYRCF